MQQHRAPPPSSVSPKKKVRQHVVTRQIFALPALQQFEPVLSSSPRSYMVPTGSIPKIDKASSNNNNIDSSSRPTSSSEITALSPTSPAVASLSPAAPPQHHHAVPHRPPRERENSPRVLRLQPPPPLGISARADVDIYRYNQGTTQRMAIRPIFEQRKEDEAQVARAILSRREGDDEERDEQLVGANEDVGDEVERRDEEQHERDFDGSDNSNASQSRINGDTDSDLKAASPIDAEEEEVEEFTTITFISPRSADRLNRPRTGSSGVRSGKQAVHTTTKVEDAVDTTQTQVCSNPMETDEATNSKPEVANARCRGDSGDKIDSSTLVEANKSDGAASTIAESQLLRPLLPGRYYEPFRFIDNENNSTSNRMPWAKDATHPSNTLSSATAGSTSRPPSARLQRSQPTDVLYKVLWKDLRTFDDRDVMLSLLLSSEATAHITLTDPPSHRVNTDDEILPITESHLTMSSQLRRDLRVLTPKWAEWMLSRVRLDSNGKFYLQVEDSDALDTSSCFNEQLCIDGLNVHVAMHALDDGSSLLISVRDLDSGHTNKIFLSKSEILKLAMSFGITTSAAAADGAEEGSEVVAKLLQDAAFLTQVAMESPVVRLGMRSKKDLGDSFSLHDLQSSEYNTADPPVSHEAHSDDASTVINLPSLRCAFYSTEMNAILLSSSSLAAVAFLSQMYTEDGLISALRHLQQKEAAQLHAQSYVAHHQSVTSSGNEDFRALIAAKVEAAKQAKLQDIAILSIIDDMLANLITFESRVALYEAKYSGGYDDHYASKVQATFRMSTQRKTYAHKKHTRMRAARLLQALQRGIIARKRYCEMKIEREKYLFYGFRSSLHYAAASMENPKQRAQEMAEEKERRRQSFLMQVLDGYIAEHGLAAPHRVSAELIESLFNEFGVVVGLSTTFGEVVASFLRGALDGQLTRRVSNVKLSNNGPPREPPRLYSTGQVNAALLLGLRSQYDDTFGLSPTTRRLGAIGDPLAVQPENGEDDEVPPRWLLKINAPFQRSNRNRLAALRLSRKAAGRKSSHLVARDFRNMLTATESLAKFESCREFWESNIRTRRAELRIYDASNKDDVVQFVLDLLIASIKDWGVDPEPLFAGLNLCVRHRQGKEIVGLVETKFNIFAQGVNQMHGKRNILSLREEIEQELEDFEKLLALRCLNIGQDHVVTIPPSEILHIILKGKVDDEYIRHALPTVLPIASITDKYELAQKMVLAYANASYGDALNSICWSCLDVAENVTVEAAQLLDRITRVDEQLGGLENELRDDSSSRSARTPQRTKCVQASAPPPSSSVASRALYLLTGAQAVTFLQFVAKVAHFNKTIQRRTLALLKPYADKFELHRLASTVAGLDSYDVTARLFDACFAHQAIYPCTRFWIQYEELVGMEHTEKARASCPGEYGGREDGDNGHRYDNTL